ncbi:hypothetical protein OG985_46000 [Streptomyces sp. NBC_00289]|uniref:hypothetical protein n=1 Tax=Streptomyces sp. NBC_00289 TaxID=2975703 RepID=UPI003252F217
MTSPAGAQPDNAGSCTTAASGMPCGAEDAARSQLWWTVHQAAGGPGRMPAHTDRLRRWSGLLIDALLAFHDDMTRLPGSQARIWQLRLALTTEQRLRPVTGGIPAHRWLVHARHRTQTRPNPTLDRRLYQSWIPHLVAAVRDLINETAAAIAHTANTEQDPATTVHLLQARHILQHTCRHLNRPHELRPPPARNK